MLVEPGQHGLSIRFTKHGGSNVERLTAVHMVARTCSRVRTHHCGPWLFLWVKISNFVMVRATALSTVMVETGEGKPPATVTVVGGVAGVGFGFGW